MHNTEINKVDILFQLIKYSFNRLDVAEDFFMPRINDQGEHDE